MIWPVRIAANAMGDTVLVDTVLIPARQLINGGNICQAEVDEVFSFI